MNRKILRVYIAPFILIGAVCIYILWPLTRPGFIITDDADWMVIRLSAFFQSFREGQFPVRFLGRLNYNFGYPVANFLYPGFLYIGSLIHIIGFNFQDTVKLILAGSAVGTGLFTYLWLVSDFSVIPALTGAISAVVSPYLLFDLYKRGSVGEVLAICIATVLLFAIRRKINWLIPPVIALLIVSHNILALLFMALTLIYCLTFRLRGMIIPTAIGIGLCAFFWVPALAEQRYIVFNSVTISNPNAYFVAGKYLNLISLHSVLLYIYLLVRQHLFQKKPPDAHFFAVCYLVVLFIVLPLSLPVWSIPVFGRLLQFPFRILSIQILIASWICAYVLENIPKVAYGPVLLIIVWLFSYQALPLLASIRYTDKPEGFYTTNESTTTTGNEYMPTWVTVAPQTRSYAKIEVNQGAAIITPELVTSQKIRARINAQQDSIIQLNTLYYPGWGVTVNNVPQQIDYHNPYGLIRVPVKVGENVLFAEFRETVFRFMTDAASLLSLGCYGIYCVYLYRLKHEKIHH